MYAAGTDSGPWEPNSLLAFDPDPELTTDGMIAALRRAPRITAALTIGAIPRTPVVDERTGELGPPTQVNGLDVFRVTGNIAGWRVEAGATLVVVRTPHCQIYLNSRDSTRIPYSELVRIIANATFTDCATPATWTAPLA